jgi:hypothetical protein
MQLPFFYSLRFPQKREAHSPGSCFNSLFSTGAQAAFHRTFPRQPLHPRSH